MTTATETALAALAAASGLCAKSSFAPSAPPRRHFFASHASQNEASMACPCCGEQTALREFTRSQPGSYAAKRGRRDSLCCRWCAMP